MLGIFLVLGVIRTAATSIFDYDVDQLMETALQSSPSTSLERCAYTLQTTKSNGELMKERFDPYFGDDKAWSLLSVNGTVPTAEQLDQYVPQERKRHPAVVSFEFIDRSTLEFMEDSAQGFVFSFDIVGSNDGRQEDIVNSILIDPLSAQVKEVRRLAKSEFRVGSFAKVLEFETVSVFRYDNETRTVVLDMNSTHLKARTGEQTINQSLRLDFTELDCSTVPVDTPVPPVQDQEAPGQQEPSSSPMPRDSNSTIP